MSNRIHLPRNLATAGLPHYSGAITSSRAMWTILTLLALPAFWGVLIFGLPALIILSIGLAAGVLSEVLAIALIFPLSEFRTELRKNLSDGSTLLISALSALSLPAYAHPALPALVAGFAVLVVKWSFGGLGKYWAHPVAAGWLFAHLSWPQGFYRQPWGDSLLGSLLSGADAVSGATHLTGAKLMLLQNGSPRVLRPLQLIAAPSGPVDEYLVRLLNERVFIPLGTILPDGYLDYLLGFRTGAIGEISVVLILLVSIFLFARRIISWQIPVAGALGMGILSFLFSGTHWGAQAATGDALFALMSGGFLFALFFLATDPVTTPYTGRGKFAFGLGFGVLAFVFREFSVLPDGSAPALLAMNMLTPLVIILSRRRPFGMPRRASGIGGGRE
jgi:electron transport complex protein RnfD